MSSKKYSSLLDINNPERQINHTLRMQNLLEQYDRQNAFLGEQVKQLLKINHLLTKNQSLNGLSQNTSLKNSQRGKFYKRNRQDDFTNQKGSKQILKIERGQINEEACKKKPIKTKENKSVKFTCDPYLEEKASKEILEGSQNQERNDNKRKETRSSNLINNSSIHHHLKHEDFSRLNLIANNTQNSQEFQDKTIRKEKSITKNLSASNKSRSRSKKIEVFSQSPSKLNKSQANLSEKSIRSKSKGLEVYSKSPPKINQDREDLAISKQLSFVQDHPAKMKNDPRIKEKIRKPTFHSVPITPISKKTYRQKIKEEQNQKPSNYMRLSSSTIHAPVPSMRENWTRPPQPPFRRQQQMPPTNSHLIENEKMRKSHLRHSSIPNFSQKQHLFNNIPPSIQNSENKNRMTYISPSTQDINLNTSNIQERALREKSIYAKGRKKFLNLVTKQMLDEKNHALQRNLKK